MFVTEDAMQVNLTPENDHEKRFMDILKSTEGQVTIHKGVEIEECMGGYLRNFGQRDRTTCITILNPKPAEP